MNIQRFFALKINIFFFNKINSISIKIVKKKLAIPLGND